MEELAIASLSLAESQRCAVCCGLDIYHLDILADSLSKSAENGCESCLLLKEGISHFNNSYHSIHLLVDGSLSVVLTDKGKKEIGVVEFYTQPGHPSVWQKIGPGRDISEDSSSDECISLAKRWLQGCLKAHTSCARSSIPALPTRVVDVGLSDTEEAHLYITGGEGADYVALSHCWGSGTPLVTTTATLEDRQTVIQFNELSKTFKDAVNVTRRLGIRYLWIDSLCIIQDSKEDWAREASRMSDVYNNATVTISADAAASPSDGLFPTATERRSLNRTEKLSCKGTDGQANYIYVRFRQGDPFHVNSTVHSGELPGKTKLSTRGWVLQEELLSPRMLHFRREEMSWICPTYSRCECRIRPAQPIPHMFRESPTAFAPSAESTHRLHLEWPFVVANFTRRHLTYASDRLAAMSGLAGWIEQRTTDTYFGGLWYEDLAFQLLWYSETQGVEAAAPATRFQEPYAPSWSWTSVTGPISYYGRLSSYISSRHPEQAQYSIHPLLRIVGIWNLPQEPDLNKYGPIKSSIIQLYAHLIPAAYSRDTKLWHLDTTVKDFDPGSVRIHLDVPAEFAPETWPDDETDPARPKYCFVLAGRWRTGAMTILRKQAVCLLVRRMTTDADHSRLFENVLTFKTLLCEGDSYVRVGLV